MDSLLREVRQGAWDGLIPTELSMDSLEVTSLQRPLPLYVSFKIVSPVHLLLCSVCCCETKGTSYGTHGRSRGVRRCVCQQIGCLCGCWCIPCVCICIYYCTAVWCVDLMYFGTALYRVSRVLVYGVEVNFGIVQSTTLYSHK